MMLFVVRVMGLIRLCHERFCKFVVSLSVTSDSTGAASQRNVALFRTNRFSDLIIFTFKGFVF